MDLVAVQLPDLLDEVVDLLPEPVVASVFGEEGRGEVPHAGFQEEDAGQHHHDLSGYRLVHGSDQEGREDQDDPDQGEEDLDQLAFAHGLPASGGVRGHGRGETPRLPSKIHLRDRDGIEIEPDAAPRN
ncbi:MAG: hypothetical protein GWM92_08300 [Gemmatimonadetes bacterium]|nr:hypothetical protein [Gemmatimonadota bacterium]NIR78643.1 hypothetical protein [Gemmatimonadota bacterium]NIT87262.1 hypothetical protein [Gemmatimonadota bacterium]NIU31106.1 hypothetical protein [Gemmatimonadota bacterium]NIU35840.1 hypothetical protein [Gemmatimonadota bacterium]